MDVSFDLNGLSFAWDTRKAAANRVKHEGITFEQAATVFFAPSSGWWMRDATVKRGTR